jgi:GH25 family lysozyme M1 (1,4-beta-N-acetylmuramidase)
MKGIDVSVWNGTIDWAKAKTDIDFAILRAGYGRLVSQKDG